jgi:PST family polysaccharide transporter
VTDPSLSQRIPDQTTPAAYRGDSLNGEEIGGPRLAGDADGREHRPLDRASLDRSLVRGVAWTGSVKWITQIAAWTATLIVARILSPDDYGLVGMAAVYLGFLTLVSEAGLGMTVIALRELRGTQLAEVHTLAALMGMGGFVLSCLVSGLLASFFGVPALKWVVVVMSVNFILISLRTVPQAVLQRELQFQRYAVLDGANALVTASASVALAFAGARYWSLVISTVAGGLVTTTLAFLWKPLGFRWPHFHELRGTLKTSREILIASVAWYVSQSADFLVAGKMLGKAALGNYTFAWSLAYSIVDKVTSLVNGVTSSIFSAAKHDRALLTRYITRIMGALALILLPATAGVALVSRELVLAVVGAKWQAAIVPLRLLVLYAGVRSLTPILSQALTITGDTRYAMHRNIAGAICLPIGFVVGARWGIVGIATAWIIVHAPVVLAPQLHRVSQHLGIGIRDYASAVAPALVSTSIMAVTVLAVSAAIPRDLPMLVVLGLKVAVGALAYAAAIWLFFRENVMALVRVLKQMRPSGPASPAPVGGGPVPNEAQG